MIVALLFIMLGILSDLLRANRILLERTLRRVRGIELALHVPPDELVDKDVEVLFEQRPQEESVRDAGIQRR